MTKTENKKNWGLVFKRSFVTSFCMGFTAGAPLLVVSTLVQGWLKKSDVDIKVIGLFALVGLPYSLKFLWAPWMDYYNSPLFSRLGRRRSWILTTQTGLAAGLTFMSFLSPLNLEAVALTAFFITFCAASQDIVIDAYRRDDLLDSELGVGSAYYMYGYRLGMLALSGGCLFVAGFWGWPWAFRCAALLMTAGPLTLLFSPEPKVARPSAPAGLAEAVVTPLKNYFQQPAPWLILLFIFFYKFGDQLATSLSTAYYFEVGYSEYDIGTVVKGFGTVATFAGVMAGGWVVLKAGIKKSLWLFGFFQMATIPSFVLLYYFPPSFYLLALVIALEYLAAGAGTSAFVAFMGSRTNRSFSATQYALLSSLMALPRSFLSAPSGYLVEWLNWPCFFYLCTVLALPAFFILYRLDRKGVFSYGQN
ncbi:AmpG family muropeptide MFS transporter [Deltaproteobacteria bacterium OttesenSCG-928-K17]|nr:AmpG family muropeptide MFS transporter [Deltaproteobacteria bacterium OttesenSCG-928-K17]